MDSLGLIQKISIFILPVLFAITVHEAAHAYAARYFGDNTAYHEGRMTLNPLKHIDPVGTILLPLLCVALGGFIFGWAKPVPVNFGRLRQPKKDMLWVAAAGPLSNLAMAAGWMVLLRVALGTDTGFSTPLMLMSQAYGQRPRAGATGWCKPPLRRATRASPGCAHKTFRRAAASR